MKQAIINLLNNSFDAIVSDGLITVATRYDRRDDEALIRIADSGSGITPEIIDKIFDPFFTTKDVGSGTGLGMAISFGIIEDHNGILKVSSVINEGSIISICLAGGC